MNIIRCYAQRKTDGIWIWGGYASTSDKTYIIETCFDNKIGEFIQATEVIPFTVRLMTELTDRNGRRIATQDIFRTDAGEFGIIRFGEYEGCVHEKHYGFYIEWQSEIPLRQDILFWLNKGCIIGNYIDSPEMLY